MMGGAMPVPPHAPNDAPAESGAASARRSVGRLVTDRAFVGLAATQFLGAFNDNVFKQLVLLLLVAVPVAAAAEGEPNARDLQWLGLFAFSFPFVLFSGYAGFLSDRFGKRTVIVLSKVAEIVVMAVGVASFAAYAAWGLATPTVAMLVGVTFLMGMQSAFFGPGKYGILPEMLRHDDLPAANGIMIMTTFLAIILGLALAGVLMTVYGTRLWVAGQYCVVIAVAGTCSSLLMRKVAPASAGLRFRLDALAVPREIRGLLARDRQLCYALVASTLFWLTAALVQPSVNALGMLQLKVGEWWTSLLVTVISVGIAAGSLVAGLVSGGTANPRVLRGGAIGIAACLFILAIPGGPNRQLLDYWGSLAMLTLAGVFTGMFAVPLQVFLQARPPDADKGRMIATQNLFNWIGILASAGIYYGGNWLLERAGWPPSGMFAMTALFMLPVAIFYRPTQQDLAELAAER
jgi:MFS family permease